MSRWYEFGLVDEVSVVCRVEIETKRETDDRTGSTTDVRMGPAIRSENCGTCNRDAWNCAGHFGAIELGTCVLPKHLAKPVVAMMRKLCLRDGCTRAILKARCGCGKRPPKIVVAKKRCEISIDDVPRSYAEIRELLCQVGDSELRSIGCRTRLENAFWIRVLVLPNTMRPWAIDPKRGWRPDPITIMYNAIVRVRRSFLDQNNSEKRISLMNRLKKAIDQLYVRSASVHSSSSDDVGILNRLSAKSGYVRQNALASRTDQSGRGVIDPAPFFRADNVGISENMANKLTVPVRVFLANIAQCRELVRADRVSRITKSDGTKIECVFGSAEHHAQRLGFGDVIHRKLQNGDDVVLNRQPTLHKGSIMGFRSLIIGGDVIRMTYPTIKPFNGDFDGDEMNVYVPQDLAAASEVRNLMSVSSNVHSNQIGGTFFGAIMDTLVGSHLLTSAVLLTPREFERFFSSHCVSKFKTAVNDQVDWTRCELCPPVGACPACETFPTWSTPVVAAVWSKTSGPRYTGHQAFSTMIQKQLNYGDLTDESKPCVYKGELLWGRITKKDIGASPNSMVDHIAKNSQTDAVTFLTKLDRGILTWIASRGFSFTREDMLVDTTDIMQDLLRETQNVFQECDIDDEDEIGARLKNAKERAMQRTIEKMKPVADQKNENAMVVMVESGSKGQKANVGQITLCLGQQSVYAPLMKTYGGRTSSAFARNDNRPETRGFVYGNFHRGLTVEEFKMHAMSGRKAVIESGLETATTGYDGKKLQKSLEDICVAYDFTVRNADRQIVQFKYGGNGYGPERLGLRKIEGAWKTKSLESPPPEIVFNPKHLKRLAKGGYADEDYMWSVLTDKFKHEFVSAATYLSPYWPKGTNGEYEYKWRDVMDWVAETASVVRQIYSSSAMINVPRAMCAPGTPVGSAAAQSIYERMCQMTLDSFHKIGDKQSGYARYKELVMPKKRGDVKPHAVFHVADAREFVRRHQTTKLSNVLKSVHVVDDVEPWETIWFETLFGRAPPTSKKIELVFSEDRLRSRCVRLADVRRVFQNETCPTHENETERWMIPPKIRIYDFDLNSLSTSLHVGPSESTFPGILIADDSNRVVELIASNESDLIKGIKRSFTVKGIDHSKTTCSSVNVTQAIWGVRAARECLIHELSRNINVVGTTNHVALLADCLLRTGKHVGINVQGVASQSNSALRQMGFERVSQFATKAAVAGCKDLANQPSAHLLVGEPINVGTGYDFVTLNAPV